MKCSSILHKPTMEKKHGISLLSGSTVKTNRVSLQLEFSNNKQASKEEENVEEKTEPRSNPTPLEHLHGDSLPPQPTASATQYTIIALRIINRRHNVSMPIPDVHHARFASRMASVL